MLQSTHLIIWNVAMVLPVAIAFAFVLHHRFTGDIRDYRQYRGTIMSRGLIASLILMVLFIVCFFITARPI